MFQKTLTIWLGFQAVCTVVEAALMCPDGYYESTASASCFRITPEKFNWQDARMECQKDYGDLIKILDNKMNDKISDKLGSDFTNKLWIGLNDYLEEGVYRWLDETTEPQYTNFVGGFWDDDTQDCITTDEGYWYDSPCEDDHKAICERPFITCPGGWQESVSSGTCLKLHTDLIPWSDARAACQAELGDLVKIESEAKDDFIQDYLRDKSADGVATWIGLSDANGDGTYYWLDEFTTLVYTNWGDSSLNYECVQIGATDDNTWSTENCDRAAQYICERSSIGCTEGWTVGPTAGTCLQFNHDKKTWGDGREVCRSEGGDLVVITDRDTNDMVGARIAANGHGRTWIGLHDKDGDGNFHWLDDDSTDLSYTNWYGDNPDGIGVDGGTDYIDCVEMGAMDDYMWSDDDCDIVGKFICERDSVICPHNWTPSGVSETCVRYRSDSQTWSEARTSCQKEGSDLVKIVDRTMNEFVVDLVAIAGSERTWIGLHYNEQYGEFFWLDETTAPTYVNWPDGGPNNAEGEDCVEIGNADRQAWSADSCDIIANFLCEKPQITCTEGWSASIMSDTCVKFYVSLQSWNDASASCKADGAELVKILDTKMNTYIAELVEVNSISVTSWIGLHDPYSTGEFVWNDETTEVTYTAWADGQPGNVDEDGNPLGNGRDCAQIGLEDDGTWHTDSCNAFTTFICEKPSETALTFIFDTPTDAPEILPDDPYINDDDGDRDDEPIDDDDDDDEPIDDDDNDDDAAGSSSSSGSSTTILTSGSTGLSGGAIAGIVFLVLAIVLVGAASWRYRDRLRRMVNSRRGLPMESMSFSNVGMD